MLVKAACLIALPAHRNLCEAVCGPHQWATPVARGYGWALAARFQDMPTLVMSEVAGSDMQQQLQYPGTASGCRIFLVVRILSCGDAFGFLTVEFLGSLTDSHLKAQPPNFLVGLQVGLFSGVS